MYLFHFASHKVNQSIYCTICGLLDADSCQEYRNWKYTAIALYRTYQNYFIFSCKIRTQCAKHNAQMRVWQHENKIIPNQSNYYTFWRWHSSNKISELIVRWMCVCTYRSKRKHIFNAWHLKEVRNKHSTMHKISRTRTLHSNRKWNRIRIQSSAFLLRWGKTQTQLFSFAPDFFLIKSLALLARLSIV